MKRVEGSSRQGADEERPEEKNLEERNFEDAFAITGHGRMNHLVVLTTGLILLNVTMESLGMSYVITAAECDLRLDTWHKGLLTASAFVGIVVSSLVWGSLSDRRGRRAVMLPALLCSALCSLASSAATSVWSMLALRFLTGVTISASSATCYAYLGEMHQSARRSAAIAWSSAFIALAFIVLPGLAWLIVPGTWSLRVAGLALAPWRVLMWSWCAPGLLAAALLAALPESPRFLLARRPPHAALPALAQLYAWNHRCRKEDYPVKRLISGSSSAAAAAAAGAGLAGAVNDLSLLFRPPLLRCVLISHTAMFGVFMLSSGMYMWVPDILNNIMKSSSEEHLTICQIIHNKFETVKNASLLAPEAACRAAVTVAVFPISMAMGAIFGLTYFAIGLLINRVGRNMLFCCIMVVCGLATSSAAVVPHGGVATALLVLALCSGCAASILPAIAVEVFPTSIRAVAVCVMYMAGRAGAAVGANVLGATLDAHCQPAFIVFGAFTAASALLILLWPQPAGVRAELEKRGLSY